MKSELFLLLVVGFVAATVAKNADSSSSEDVDNDNDVPSMLGMLGSKVAMADNWNEDYEEDSDDDLLATTTAAPAAPCCFPSVWQGRVYSDFGFAPISGGRRRRSGDDDDDEDDDNDDYDKKGKKRKRGGRPIASRSLDQVYVDGSNQRLAGNKLESHGQRRPLNISYIFVVGPKQTGDLYLFSRTAQKCRHRQMHNVTWRQQCIPANATDGGQYSLGPDAGGLTVQSWMFQGCSKRADAVVVGDEGSDDVDSTKTTPRPRPRPRPRMWLAANVLVIPGSCIPVLVQEEGSFFRGRRGDDIDTDYDDDDFSSKPKPRPRPRPKPRPRGEAFVGSAYFSGLQAKIVDPSVFTVPSYCKKTANTLYYDELEDELPTVLERFLLL